MELKDFLLCRQETATAPYPASPTESSGCRASFMDLKNVLCIVFHIVTLILSSVTILKSCPHADVHISDTSEPTNSDLKSSHRFLNLSLPKAAVVLTMFLQKQWRKVGPPMNEGRIHS